MSSIEGGFQLATQSHKHVPIKSLTFFVLHLQYKINNVSHYEPGKFN